ncbi:Ubiquitin-conjugating enzyme E2 J2 [Rhizoclosmatium hyalinum]|nr:Ubiquitin-conjugating enzyme E2 J2 [Rhizoclosmatium hyalinum]
MDIQPNDYSALTDLFKAGWKAEEERAKPSASSSSTVQKLTPGSIGPSVSSTSAAAAEPSAKKDSKEIWDEEEIEEVDVTDPRPQPEYTLAYRQKVSSEDMYLGMSGKTPGFHDSDDLIVTVLLPGTEFKDIELTVTKEKLDVRCPKFKLLFWFPREVKEDQGSAKWNREKGELIVSVPVKPITHLLPIIAAIVRLRKEYNALQKEPVPFILTKPLESNILEWHYVITGPKDTVYEGGVYWGKVVFPTDYPFAPPAIQMITPSGRFTPSTRLCLSMSDFHPETWCPGWNVGTILNGLLSFMVEETQTSGSIKTTDEEKKKLAGESLAWNKANAKFVELFPEL